MPKASDAGRSIPPLLIGLFAIECAVPDSLGRLPLQYLLKEGLGISVSGLALFFALVAIPWYLKPLFGLLADFRPLWGSRRRSYVLLGLVGGAAAWLALIVIPHRYVPLLGGALVLNAVAAFASASLGGSLVDIGQRHGITGKLSSLRLLVVGGGATLAGLAGGFLARRPFGLTAGIAAGILGVAAVCALALPERRSDTARADWNDARRALLSRPLWIASGLLFMVLIAPGFETPLFFYQTDTLGFSPELIGSLKLALAVGGLAGALLYVPLCKHIPVRRLVRPIVSLHAVAAMAYIFYVSPLTAAGVSLAAGFSIALSGAVFYDMAARAAPAGGEATGFGLIASVANVTLALSDILGSFLYSHLHVGLHGLIILNAGTTWAAVPFLVLIPDQLLERADSA